MSWTEGDQDRRLHSIVRIGTVTEVDPSTGRARVSLGGEAVTNWIPFTAVRAGGLNSWQPVTAGEQVVVISPGGDTAQGIIVGSLHSSATPAPSSDGGEFRFEIGGSTLSITSDAILLSSNGSTLQLDAGGIALNGARINLN